MYSCSDLDKMICLMGLYIIFLPGKRFFYNVANLELKLWSVFRALLFLLVGFESFCRNFKF